MKTMVPALLLVGFIIGCSVEQPEEEKSRIDAAVEEVAREMVERIEQPIDKARAAKDLEDKRMEQLRKQAD